MNQTERYTKPGSKAYQTPVNRKDVQTSPVSVTGSRWDSFAHLTFPLIARDGQTLAA